MHRDSVESGMSKLTRIKYYVARMLPYSVRAAIYGYKDRRRRRKRESVEGRLKELRDIILFNHPIHQVPCATGKLRLLQEGNAVLLQLFARKCQENGLRYWLDYGTLLGAVRHQGFIPWDDDLDASMPRPDYERLLEMLPVIFPKEEGFTYSEHAFLQIGYRDTPLNLDIYPYFFASDTYENIKKDFFLNKLSEFKKKIIFIGGKINYSGKQLQEMIQREVLDGREALSETMKPAIFLSPAITFTKNTLLPYDFFFPLKRMIFEGVELNVPNCARQYLEFFYGDYMSYPPRVGYQHVTVEDMVKNVSFQSAVNCFIDKYTP